MKKFRLLVKSDPKTESPNFSRRPTLAFINRDLDSWALLENITKRRGSVLDLETWKQKLFNTNKDSDSVSNCDDVDGSDKVQQINDEMDGVGNLGDRSELDIEDDILKHHYTKRLTEFGQKFYLTPIQLAIVERRPDVLQFLLELLSTSGLIQTLKCIMKPVKKAETLSPTKRNLKLSTMINLGGGPTHSHDTTRPIDWEDTLEWTCLHLALKYHTESLEVLLNTMMTKLKHEQIIQILGFNDSKGRSLLHLAARQQDSPEAAKIMIDTYSMVDEEPRNLEDNEGLLPLHFALKFGNVELVQIFLEFSSTNTSRDDTFGLEAFFSLDSSLPQSLNGISNGGFGVDSPDLSSCSDNSMSRAKARSKRSRENLLQYCSTPDICRLMIQRGCKPDLNAFLAQSSEGNAENLEIFLDDSMETCDNLVILDFSLAMEQDRDGDLTTDGESLFLHRLLKHNKLLQSPIAESLQSLKWHVCKNIILLDLLIYFTFISCLTGVISYSTSSLSQDQVPNLSSVEKGLVEYVLTNYKDYLVYRGWQYVPRSTSSLDPYIYGYTGTENISVTLVPLVLENKNEEFEKFFILYYFTIFLSLIFVLRELLELKAQRREYFKSAENIFEMFIIFLTILCQCFIFYFYPENVYFYEILQVVTVFFSWLGLTFHFAKLPSIGIYINLAIKVFQKLVLSLLMFTTILLAFALSFHLALRKHGVFDNAFTSFLKMINMMAGEYNFDYNFTFEAVRAVGGSNGLVQLLLVAFILLVTITIANMIIAIIIANIKELQEEAEHDQLTRTVKILSTVHNVKQTLIRIFPCLKGVFAPTLHDFVGKKCVLCVQIDRQSPALPWYSKLQNALSSSTIFYPVYTYDKERRILGEATGLVLPHKVVNLAISICRDKQQKSVRIDKDLRVYKSDWLQGSRNFL